MSLHQFRDAARITSQALLGVHPIRDIYGKVSCMLVFEQLTLTTMVQTNIEQKYMFIRPPDNGLLLIELRRLDHKVHADTGYSERASANVFQGNSNHPLTESKRTGDSLDFKGR